LIIGIFSPTLYRIGGAELVAISMTNALKQQGYKVIVSTTRKLNRTKMRTIFGSDVNFDAQMVFPFHLFPPYDHFNVYTIALQSYALRLKCDVLVDAYAISPFPWTDVIYFQGSSLLRSLSDRSVRSIFFLPYFNLLRSVKSLNKKIVFTNSEFTRRVLMEVFRNETISPLVLYPPVATKFFGFNNSDLNKPREDTSITVSRISPEKRLELIPHIAKLTAKNISFIIVGSCQSKETYYSILKLAKKLKVDKRVKVLIGISQRELRNLLLNSKVYLHTMKDEAFGISIVESMASGCTPIVHDSGGPKEFVPEHLRYKSAEEAAMKTEKAISEWSPEKAQRVSEIASRFNEEEFSKRFTSVVNSYIKEMQ
jgi:glycosyltransferase involved in cell wall biosynthesis